MSATITINGTTTVNVGDADREAKLIGEIQQVRNTLRTVSDAAIKHQTANDFLQDKVNELEIKNSRLAAEGDEMLAQGLTGRKSTIQSEVKNEALRRSRAILRFTEDHELRSKTDKSVLQLQIKELLDFLENKA